MVWTFRGSLDSRTLSVLDFCVVSIHTITTSMHPNRSPKRRLVQLTVKGFVNRYDKFFRRPERRTGLSFISLQSVESIWDLKTSPLPTATSLQNGVGLFWRGFPQSLLHLSTSHPIHARFQRLSECLVHWKVKFSISWVCFCKMDGTVVGKVEVKIKEKPFPITLPSCSGSTRFSGQCLPREIGQGV